MLTGFLKCVSKVASSPPAPPEVAPLWEFYYKHGKALKRLGRGLEALARYCDACAAWSQLSGSGGIGPSTTTITFIAVPARTG